MCGISSVAGASGGGAPGKVAQTEVAGANGTGVHQHAGCNDMPAAKGGGAEGAVAGAEATGGGAAPGTLAAALESLKAALAELAQAVQALTGGAQVAGVNGQAATTQQYVARSASTTKSSGKEDNSYEQRVLELINQERAKYGLGAVSYNGALDNAAEKHNEQMALVGKMAHEGVGDGDPGERIRAEGWRNSWGENVATGQTSPEQVVREWMNSPEHRRNILDPSFKYMGVSYTTASNGRSYWAQEFGS